MEHRGEWREEGWQKGKNYKVRITVRAKTRTWLLSYGCKKARISLHTGNCRIVEKNHAPAFYIKGLFQGMLCTVPWKWSPAEEWGLTPTERCWQKPPLYTASSRPRALSSSHSSELYFPNWGHQNGSISTIWEFIRNPNNLYSSGSKIVEWRPGSLCLHRNSMVFWSE